MIEYIQGNIFASDEKVIAHGCNCLGLMGAGVAKIVHNNYPIVYDRYKRTCEAGVFVPGYAQFVIDHDNDRCFYNLATQRQPGKFASYFFIYLAFANMLEHANANGISRIAFPRIGAGIGGLAWDLVEKEIERAVTDTQLQNTKLVCYSI